MAHILLVDDELQLLSIFEQYLTHDGHTVETAQNGLAALKLLTVGTFDLVITDIIMPEQDGLWVVNELHRLEKKTRIIIMTGGSQRIDRQYLLDLAKVLPVQKVLSKPISYEQMRTAVDSVLGLAANTIPA
jgi:CheY-like chemotaxis protein